MASAEFSPRAPSGEFSSAIPARFGLPDLIGFAAYAIAVGGGQPAFDFLLSAVLGGYSPPAPEGEEAPHLSLATDGASAMGSPLPPEQDRPPELSRAAATGPGVMLSSQIESWQPPLVTEPARLPAGVS